MAQRLPRRELTITATVDAETHGRTLDHEGDDLRHGDQWQITEGTVNGVETSGRHTKWRCQIRIRVTTWLRARSRWRAKRQRGLQMFLVVRSVPENSVCWNQLVGGFPIVGQGTRRTPGDTLTFSLTGVKVRTTSPHRLSQAAYRLQLPVALIWTTKPNSPTTWRLE